MRWFWFIIFLLILTLLNTGHLLDFISIGNLDIRPDFLLIALVFFSIKSDSRDAIIASFIIGLAADLSGPDMVMGPYFISYGIFGSMVSQMRKVIIMNRVYHQAGAVFIMTIIAGGVAQLLTIFKLHEVPGNTAAELLGTAIYSGLTGPVVWVLLSLLSLFVIRPQKPYIRPSTR